MSISLLGQLLSLIALACAGAGTVTAFAAARNRSLEGWAWARGFAYGFGGAMLAANLLMIYALLVRDYSVAYVGEVGGWSTPNLFAVISLWASLNGSILLWGGVLGVYVVGLTFTYRKTHREYMPWTLGTLLAICVFFALLVSSIASPFAPTDPIRLEQICATPAMPEASEWAAWICPDGKVAAGFGPNALLQNHWLMAVHPPTLYLGYVGMAVPFAMCAAALFAGRLEAGWMGPVRRWFLIPWAFLTVGIVLGGWWSYAVLGWGGYWAWDPVENASFMPWLTGTAFLHSSMMMERRGSLKTWTLILGLGTFILTMFGTFLTRSGIFNSVHAFADGPIGPMFFGFIVLSVVFSVVLLAVREESVRTHDSELPKQLRDTARPDPRATSRRIAIGAFILAPVFVPSGWALMALLEPSLGGDLPAVVMYGVPLVAGFIPGALVGAVPALGDLVLRRGFSILLQNIAFCLFTFVVFLGTTYPLLVEKLRDTQVSVGAPYYDWFSIPLGVSIVWLMGVGPLVPWARTSVAHGWRLFLPPVIFSAVVTAIFAATGVRSPYVLLSLYVCFFALWANGTQFVEPVVARVRKKGEQPLTAAARVFTRGRRRFGGHIAHFGVIMAVLSIVASRAYSLERDLVLTVDVPQAFGDWELVYRGTITDEQARRESTIATIEARRDGELVETMKPALNLYPLLRREPLPDPAIRSTPFSDLYVSLMRGDQESATVRLMEMPYMMWLWVSAAVIGFGTLLAIIPLGTGRRRRRAAKPSGREEAA